LTALSGGYLARPAPSGLADVVEIVVDKGIVIDAYVRVSLLGIELLTIDARVVVASVDTYLRFAEATNRLDLLEEGPRSPLDLAMEGAGNAIEHVATNVVEDKVSDGLEKVEDGAEKLGPLAQAVVSTAEKAAARLAESLGGDDEN
jgi:hypothetical protein